MLAHAGACLRRRMADARLEQCRTTAKKARLSALAPPPSGVLGSMSPEHGRGARIAYRNQSRDNVVFEARDRRSQPDVGVKRDGGKHDGGKRDGAGAKRDGGVAKRDGGGAKRDGGGAKRDGGGTKRDGAGAKRDGGNYDGGKQDSGKRVGSSTKRERGMRDGVLHAEEAYGGRGRNGIAWAAGGSPGG